MYRCDDEDQINKHNPSGSKHRDEAAKGQAPQANNWLNDQTTYLKMQVNKIVKETVEWSKLVVVD